MKKAGWYGPDGKVCRGLPEPSVNAFLRKIKSVSNQFFLKDEDGEFPVDVTVVDRTLCDMIYYQPMLRVKDTDGIAKVMENLRVTRLNLSIAVEQVKRAHLDLDDVLSKNAIK